MRIIVFFNKLQKTNSLIYANVIQLKIIQKNANIFENNYEVNLYRSILKNIPDKIMVFVKGRQVVMPPTLYFNQGDLRRHQRF